MLTPRSRTSIRVNVGRLMLLCACLACAGSGDAWAQPNSVLLSVDLPDRPGQGETVFEQKGCSRCHSIGGVGPVVGPDLGRLIFLGNVLDLGGELWNHAPAMREKMAALKIPRPELTTEEAIELVAFLTALRHYETQVREAGNQALGRGVFVKKGCAGCHEAQPGKPASAPALSQYRGRYAPIVFTQALWNHAPAMTAAMQARGVPVPVFAGREMTDLAAYLQVGLSIKGPEPTVFEIGNPRRGRDLFDAKGCRTCHAVAGVGGTVGPDLGNGGPRLSSSVPEIAGLMWNHSQQMTAEFEKRGIVRPTFAGQEMSDLISYLYFVNYTNVRGTPARGEKLFVEKCARCHTPGGKNVGPNLLAAAGLDRPIGIITAMWNHGALMQKAAGEREMTLPRLERGETADLAAYLISKRASARAK